tara:strand:+ start:243 stop:704 length:462 start_codon:yes stop_codon:yes gene_type:complete
MPNEMMMDPNSVVREGEMGSSPSPAEDLKLVMTFLQNIKPGDMSPEAAQQLMAVGQGVQNGVMLTPEQREMFKSVVGEIDRFPVEEMGTLPQGNTNPDIMKDPSSAVRAGEMPASSPNVMNMDQATAAGFINPTRPQARPTAPMTSMRPQMRR